MVYNILEFQSLSTQVTYKHLKFFQSS